MNLIIDYILEKYEAMEREINETTARLTTIEQQLLALPEHSESSELVTQITNQKIRLAHEMELLEAERATFTTWSADQ